MDILQIFTKKTNVMTNRIIDIAIGSSARSKAWVNKKVTWDWFKEKLRDPIITKETLKEFLALSKADQGAVKDVGGFVGGYIRQGRRKSGSIMHRQIVALDIDSAHVNFWDDFTMLYDCCAIIHGTHKHSEDSPRYRLIIPLSREVSCEEYQAISRRIAGNLDINIFDPTTFECERLMFWPSIPKDVDYYIKEQDGNWLDADSVLASYTDWSDSTSWPVADSVAINIREDLKKQQDPCEKPGIVGTFCRTYPIDRAIDVFIPDIYARGADGRYTYSKGSTSGGLVLYDDKFAYSHHGTDPVSGKLTNAFDLVRIHKFGHLDIDPSLSGNSTKSYKAMITMAIKDELIKSQIFSERLESSVYDFSDISEPIINNDEPANINWAKGLEIDKAGKYLSNANNINLILTSDPAIKGVFQYNTFDSKKYIVKSTPWRSITNPEPLRSVDYAGARNYIECVYGISGNLKIDDALELEFERRAYHPVRNYLNSLNWDGVNRIDSLLQKIFGADNNPYTSEAMLLTLKGAVARVLHPGVKFDTVLTLVGPQGCGKSTFFKTLAKRWFSDTFLGVNGKEALEQIQGSWIIEMAELSGLKKADIESVKHFISKQEDTFRPAYARTPERFLRQCIFVGTTNNMDFLRDPSGNRRFLPIDVNVKKIEKSVFDISDNEVDQLWAEAVTKYKEDNRLYLSAESESYARKEQRKHSEEDERTGIIEDFLAIPLTDKWDNLSLYDRRSYFNDPLAEHGSIERSVVCVAEVWCECLGKQKEEMDRYKTREINDILKGLQGWELSRSTKNFKHYGKQKYYVKK